MDPGLDEVVRSELALLDPAVRADAELVRALLHPEFCEVGASGRVWTTEEIVVALGEETGRAPVQVRDVAASELAPGVVLLTYRVEGAGGASRRSSVWLREPKDGRWLLRYHQGTREGTDPAV